ncbi:MAG: hypothetical protein QQN63_11770 [Nitrosopumilus sp.]
MGRILEVRGDITETYHYDESTGKSYISTSQKVKPYLDANAEKMKNDTGNWKGEMHHIASIPMSIIENWNQELGDNCLKKEFRPWFMAKIKDREYSKLRVKGGKL